MVVRSIRIAKTRFRLPQGPQITKKYNLKSMPLILQTNKFIIEAPDNPHHDRQNGGHVKVRPIDYYLDCSQMPLDLYSTMMQLVVLVGEAVKVVMKEKGIDIVRINYQDNGNWAYFPDFGAKPNCHIHLYCRTNSEKHPDNHPRFEAFPHTLYFPYRGENPTYYKNFHPYTTDDCEDIKIKITQLLDTSKYQHLKDKI